jgi:Holliday junction resolvase RusA-like endonuclease
MRHDTKNEQRTAVGRAGVGGSAGVGGEAPGWLVGSVVFEEGVSVEDGGEGRASRGAVLPARATGGGGGAREEVGADHLPVPGLPHVSPHVAGEAAPVAPWARRKGYAALRVDVEGIPRPQPRPRLVKRGKGVKVVSTTGKAVGWKRVVGAAIAEAVRARGWATVATGPVKLRLLVRFPTKDKSRWWSLRTANRNADFDNVAKLIADALTVGGVWADDGQVAVAEYVAVWCPEENAGVTIDVEPLASATLEWARDAAAVIAPDWL